MHVVMRAYWNGNTDVVGNSYTGNALFPGWEASGLGNAPEPEKYMLVNMSRLWDIIPR